MGTLIEQLIKKMGLRYEENLLEKTKELVRLLQLRSTNVPLQVNEYGKIVLCADLAAVMLGIAFDKENAVKLSGLRKSHYANNKRMFEKLLDLTKIVSVNDICIQLALNEEAKKSNEILELYKEVIAKANGDIDISHPQYAAMAVYQACKLNKHKISKSKIQSYSNLRPAQWTQLEQRWDKFMDRHYKNGLENKLNKQNLDEKKVSDDKKEIQEGKIKCGEKRSKIEMEDYEQWKKRILRMAEKKLKGENFEKENYQVELC